MRNICSRRRFLWLGATGVAGATLAMHRVAGATVADPSAASPLAADPLRPQYHLLAPGNWMNDPNGPVYWRGKYHLFYQINPHGAAWGDICWAHAESPDLVHWRHLPIALAPTPGTADSYGCWSGTADAQGDRCLVFYTAVQKSDRETATLPGDPNLRETQCVAISNDADLQTWQKRAEPVVAAPPHGMAVTGFRDPTLWRDSDIWYMLIGSGVRGQGGAVLLYRSHDLMTWEYLHPLFEGKGNGKDTPDPVDSGQMWECPDFFDLDGHQVLLYSTERKVYWTVGKLDRTTMRFEPATRGLLDSGAYYAPKSMLDATGRRILWGWIPETRSKEEYVRAGWSGAMALPRVLNVSSDGQLRMSVPAVFNNIAGAERSAKPAATVPGLAARIVARIPAGGGCTVRSGAADLVSLTVSADGKQLTANGTKLDYKAREAITVYVDGSVIELFVGDRAAHTMRAYPQLKQDAALTVTAIGEHTEVSVEPMRPISADRLTT